MDKVSYLKELDDDTLRKIIYEYSGSYEADVLAEARRELFGRYKINIWEAADITLLDVAACVSFIDVMRFIDTVDDAYKEIFDDVIDIKKVGAKGYWFTPWDNLIRLTGITETMMDLILRPEFINALVERFVDASMIRLERYENLGIWASNNDNVRVGSGGYGYCSDLENPDIHRTNAQTKQLWGCGNAQIFTSVSPDMHWEFSLKHELRWMERFGLSYYGCCESLHTKLHMLEKIPNLRKISMSPWSKLEVVNEFAKDKYILSCKPNPAVFAEDSWRPEQAKEDILDILKKSDGCSIELIMKDVSTLRYKPQRLWDWAKIAQDTINEYF